MHELSVTQAILEIALCNAAKSNAVRVTDLNITIGDLSSFVDDSIQFYWDLISHGTLCEGAKLHFTRIPAKLVCLECGASYSIPDGLTPCPDCFSSDVRVIQGEGFRIESMDVEVGEESPPGTGKAAEDVQAENYGPGCNQDIPRSLGAASSFVKGNRHHDHASPDHH